MSKETESSRTSCITSKDPDSRTLELFKNGYYTMTKNLFMTLVSLKQNILVQNGYFSEEIRIASLCKGESATCWQLLLG